MWDGQQSAGTAAAGHPTRPDWCRLQQSCCRCHPAASPNFSGVEQMMSAASTSSSPSVSSSPVSCSTFRPKAWPNLACQSTWRSCTSALMGPAAPCQDTRHAQRALKLRARTTATGAQHGQVWPALWSCRQPATALRSHWQTNVQRAEHRCAACATPCACWKCCSLTKVDGLVAAMHGLELLLHPWHTHGLCWPRLRGSQVLAEEAQDGKLHDACLA